MKIFKLNTILLLLAGILFPLTCMGVQQSRLSGMSDQDRLLQITADVASADKRDAKVQAAMKQLIDRRQKADTTVYNAILKYGRQLMAQGRQEVAFELFSQLTGPEINEKNDDEFTDFSLGMYLLLGASVEEIGMMNLGLEYYTKGLRMAENCGNEQMQANFLNNIGVCFFKVKDVRRAKEYFSKALALNRRLGKGREIFLNYNNLAEIDIADGNLNKALDNSLLALQQIKPSDQSDADLYFYMQSNIGALYTKMRQYELAESYLTNAIEHQTALDFPSDLYASYINKSELGIATQRYDSALYYADKALAITSRLNNPLMRSQAMIQQAKVYELKGEYDRGFKILTQAYALKDSIDMAENRDRIEQYRRIYELDKSNSGRRSVMASWNPVVVFFVMFAVVLVLVFITAKLFIYKRNRDRALADKARLHREIQHIHESQMGEALQARRELQEALALSHRQLTTYTMEKVRLSQSIEDASGDLKRLLLDVGPRSKDLAEGLRGVIRKLSRLNSGDDWSEFHYHFEKVNPSFYRRLQEAHPSITEKEKRLCAFLSLGLNTKEIAQLTFREVRSIESSRNRLRKKLELPSDANLTDYCRSFSG